MLLPAIIFITAALVFYSIGVWSEHLQRVLSWWHAGLFALGLICDGSGTFLMTRLAESGSSTDGGIGTGLNAVMAVTGAAALLLMLVHLTWAVVVLLRNHQAEKKAFHKFSLIVWGIWLVPYLTGAVGTSLG
ncbi:MULTISPECIES: HsmA family protein [unclassified Arthrobacter]|uniref:HsmA family protein n=1 Tax=unclassified Arthrobacter TaxID=235627 RepID=UPI002DF98071|nr:MULTISPECIES: HsmA family protein [unclassified Arthrobacter]MEC5190825.1 putative repeat protein (TIGR03987 family) [Arthrobacter sp. MP_M4]MEC5202157.1 putative repeat protein (TIGR03987 family) [Arthrobacter sp. MP_M7]